MILLKFFDIDETTGKLTLYQKKEDEQSQYHGNVLYREICSALCDFFDYFFYDQPTKTKKLIIGDTEFDTNGLEQSYECTRIGRSMVMKIISMLRKKNITMKEIFESPSEYIYNSFPSFENGKK